MLEKIKKFIKDNSITLITFFVGVIIILAIYILKDVKPFGDKSLLQIDFFHQYAPFLGELQDKIKNGGNFLYNFNVGFGLPFFRNFANYLGSIFNVIILFFKKENILVSFSVIIGLKAVLSATTMSYFLTKKFKSKNKFFIPISLLYAFSAYMHAYYWNLMWLDSMIYLPIIILGIERMIDENKSLLYIAFLALALLSNYFTAYMVCLFSVIYFIVHLFIKTDKFNIKEIGKKSFKFIISSALAGGLTAFILVPQFLALQTTSATTDAWPDSQYYAFTLWEFFGNHFTGVGPTIFASDFTNAANISVGILPIALFLLFLINAKIKPKVKIGYSFIILFFAIGFFYAPLDFIWHAFHVPNDLPYRYTFIYAFVMIIISAYSLFYIKEHKIINVSVIFIFTTLLVLVLYLFKFENIDQKMIILNIVIISVSYILYLIGKNYPKVVKFTPYILILLISVECILVANKNWDVTQINDDFYYKYDEIQNTIDYIKENEKDDMVRFEKTWILTYNDPSWYDYYGQGMFTSVGYESMAKLNIRLGMPGNHINSYHYKDNTPIYDLLFNIRYYMGNFRDNKRYSEFYEENGMYTYKAKFDTNLMYHVYPSIMSWNHNLADPFMVQNEFIRTSTGVTDVLNYLEASNEEVIYSDNNNTISKLTVKNPGDTVYFYINSSIEFIIIGDTIYHTETDNFEYAYNVEDEYDIYHIDNIRENHIIPYNSYEEDFSVYVGYGHHSWGNPLIYYINNDAFYHAVNILNQNKINITDFKESHIYANVESDYYGTIFTSIPYDKGWRVYVNGEKKETFKIADALMAFNVDEGYNELELKFIPYGISYGFGISIISLGTLIILYKKRKI